MDGRVLMSALLASPDVAGGEGPSRRAGRFARDLEPLFQAQCLMCHNALLAQAGLRWTAGTRREGGRLRSRLRARTRAGRASSCSGSWARAWACACRRTWSPGRRSESLSCGAGSTKGRPGRPLSQSRRRRRRRPPPQRPPAHAQWPSRRNPPPDFGRDIAPLFREHCVACHGPTQQQSQLRLDSRTLALRGGLSGKVSCPARVPEQPARAAAARPGHPAHALQEGSPAPRSGSRSSAPGSTRAPRARTTRSADARSRPTGPT